MKIKNKKPENWQEFLEFVFVADICGIKITPKNFKLYKGGSK